MFEINGRLIIAAIFFSMIGLIISDVFVTARISQLAALNNELASQIWLSESPLYLLEVLATFMLFKFRNVGVILSFIIFLLYMPSLIRSLSTPVILFKAGQFSQLSLVFFSLCLISFVLLYFVFMVRGFSRN